MPEASDPVISSQLFFSPGRRLSICTSTQPPRSRPPWTTNLSSPFSIAAEHRDEHSRDNDADALLAQDRSVASDRSMSEIAKGKGRGPKPFILATKHPAAAEAI